MPMLREGQKVSYTGMDDDGLVLGDQGRVLLVQGAVINVMWTTGACADDVTAAYEHDLVVMGRRATAAVDDLGDSLELGGLSTFSARAAYDEGGSVALLNEMAASGHLSAFQEIAEEALNVVASRIRQDPSFRTVVAELDEDEAEGVLRLASACLIRDAFSTEEG
jgi:hypothetical protein